MRNTILQIKPLLLITLIFSGQAWAEEGDIPIPPRRPDIVNVSPAYVEYLKNRALYPEKSNKRTEQPSPQAMASSAEANDVEAGGIESPPPTFPQHDIKRDASNIIDIERSEILDLIEGKHKRVRQNNENADKYIPIPDQKPTFHDEEQSDIEAETTLISFAVPPAQIYLEQDVKDFLQDYALPLMRKKQSVRMEIHAYATPIDNQEYSDVRVSLARALEVRTFLINNNISASRLKLTPIGSDKSNNSDDRIDILFIDESP